MAHGHGGVEEVVKCNFFEVVYPGQTVVISNSSSVLSVQDALDVQNKARNVVSVMF